MSEHDTIIQKFFACREKLPSQTRDFIQWLKKKPPANIDHLVQEIHEQVFSEVDCLECANCCKTVGPAVKDIDLERLSKYLRVKPSKLIDDYLVMDDEGDYVFKSHPCPFLAVDNYCTVYDSRPRACREFPHTDRRRTMQIIAIHQKNIECCPVVFEVFERLRNMLKT
jgi:Fe-S-cluster containining protein